jgi:mono/diheme cytochrome c family protein
VKGLIASVAAALIAGPLAVAATATAADEETPEILAPGEGREETFYYCIACHNTALIRRSGFTRQQWDELMDWMSEKHGMNPLEGELRETIVNYLAEAYPPRRQRPPAFANPFARD